MEAKYEKRKTLGPSDCDITSRLGIPQTFEMFMDIASLHAERLGIGAQFMMETGMFWLTVRTRIRFIKRPAMLEEVMVTTWPNKPRGPQAIRNYVISNENGEVLAEGKTQWAVLDTKTGSLVKVDDVFPEDLEPLKDKVLDEPFSKIKEDLTDCEEYAKYKVRSVDIDLGGHMNNAAYVRALFGTFTNEELKAMKVKDCEVCFRHPCFEGDTLTFYRRNCDDGSMEVIAVKDNGETIILVKLK